MSLPWVRLDTAFAWNPKVLVLVGEKDGHRAAFLYVCGLAYSGAHGTDGWIPEDALGFIHGRSADASALVKVGLWIDQPGGWVINGWDEKQESNDETKQRRVRAQAAAQARWDGHERMPDAARARKYRAKKRSDS